MEPFKNPTPQEQEDFLIYLYFGPGDNYLELCVDRAYLDFNRTLHGIKDKQWIYKSAKKVMCDNLRALSEDKKICCIEKKYEEFDKWHEHLCSLLCNCYKAAGFEHYHIGQAQKWINMSLKYIFTMGETRLPNYSYLYECCHVPIDNIIIKNFSSFNATPPLPPLSCAWSRLNNYKEYMEFQEWVRNNFKESAPLAVEFFIWQLSSKAQP